MLSMMAGKLFADNPILIAPLVALCIFLVLFSVLTWKALRRSKATIAHLSQLPLEADRSHCSDEPVTANR